MVKAIPVGAVTSGAEEFSDDIYGFDCFQGAPDFSRNFHASLKMNARFIFAADEWVNSRGLRIRRRSAKSLLDSPHWNVVHRRA
jgi:hypothetical protein